MSTMKQTTRPTDGKQTLHVRVDAEDVARLDRVAAKLRAERQGLLVSKADAARMALSIGLAEMEAEQPPQARKAAK